MVRKMGYLNPHTESRYLLRRMTPMLEKYHAASRAHCVFSSACVFPGCRGSGIYNRGIGTSG
jgi:hypothetical protein